MAPDRFNDILGAMQWAPGRLAKIVGFNEKEGRRWGGGEARIPPQVADWLERCAAFIDANPPPVKVGARRQRKPLKVPGSRLSP